MRSVIDNNFKYFTGEDFLAALTVDHTIQINKFIEDEEDTVLPDMMVYRDTERQELIDYDFYMALFNNQATTAFPNSQVFVCLTVGFWWSHRIMTPKLEWKILEARVFEHQGDMEMFKFKEVVDNGGPNPIFN